MKVMKIIRDKDGVLINIGDWDYKMKEYLEPTPIPKDWDPSKKKNFDLRPIVKQKATNPLPDGAYEEVAEVVVGKDGGLYLANDPKLATTLS